MSSSQRKREDLAEGCRELELADRERAAATPSLHVRACFERSANAWAERASLLDRLEASFKARVAANAGERPPKAKASKPSVDHSG
jgi:hypothetical protein